MIRKVHQKRQIIITYLQENIKEIFSVSLVFLIGIIIGIMLVNKVSSERKKRDNNIY